MKKRTAWIAAAGVAAVALGAAAVGAVALVLRGQHGGSGARWSTSGQTYLEVALDGELPEQQPTDLNSWFETHPPTVRHLVESIDRAAADEHMRALVLKVGFLQDAGWGKVQEVRDAVGRFRAKGKPVYAYLEMAGNKEYYLATAATKIYAQPEAILDITGLSAEVTFLKGTLDKLGVQAQFEGIGKYKNAPNQFTEPGFTEPHREQMDALLDSIYAQYVEAVAQSRGLKADEVQARIDAGPYDGKMAKAAGLVDDLLFADQLKEKIKADRLTPGRYLRSSSGFGFGRPKIALVYAVGEISSGESQQGGLGGGVAGSDTLSRALRLAREDDEVKAVVLRVDSPGGSGTASDVIWREVALTRQKKPVVVSMGDVAASGGYYIAMGSDAIVAEPDTITGSIGVFSGKFSLAGLFDKVGVNQEVLSRGAHADIFSAARPWDDSERARIHEMMASFYKDFVSKAAQGRKKTPEEVDAVAQGRVWSGLQAKEQGLVDRLGGLDVALQVAREKAHIPAGADVAVTVLPQRKGLWETLMERQQDDPEAEARVPAELRSAVRWMVHLNSGQPLARLPFDIRLH